MNKNITSESAERTGDRRDGYIYAFLFILGVLPYLNTLWDSFVYDDGSQIVENPYVHSFRYWKQILTTPVWSFKYAKVPTNYYRPLMTIEYLLLYKTYGPISYVFHLTNVLTHTLVVIVLFAVVRRLSKSDAVAILAAALFALHPMHTESVAWIAAVPDLQLAVFLLIAFWFFLDLGEPERKRWWTPIAVNLTFFFALFSKEPAIAFPAIAMFYEYVLRADRNLTNWKVKLSRYGSFFLLAGFYLATRALLIGGLVPKLQRPRLTWPSAILSAVSLFGQYMVKLVWPFKLKMFYDFYATTSVFSLAFLHGLAWLIGIGLLCAFLWKRNRVLLLPVLWMVSTLAPALNARWMPGVVIAERYLYLPSIGYCWLVAGAIVALWNARKIKSWPPVRVAIVATGLTVACVFAVIIVRRNQVWSNDLTFFTDGVRQSPGNPSVRSDLGYAYWTFNKRPEAIEQWNSSIAQDPNNFWALNNLGMANVAAKQFEDAVPKLQHALRDRPQFSDAHLNLAEAFEGLNRERDAETEYQVAIECSPLNYDAHNRFGAFYQTTGRVPEAKNQFLLSLAAQPNAGALNGLGDIALSDSQTAVAQSYYLQATDLDTFDAHAHYQLVLLYAASGRGADALREFDLAQRTDPGEDDLGQNAKAAVSKLKLPK